MGTGTVAKAASLADKADVKFREQQSEAHARYVELITDDSGDDKHVEELLKLAGQLGKSTADLYADRNAIAEGRRMLAGLHAQAGAAAVAERMRVFEAAHLRWTKAAADQLQRQHFALIQLRQTAEHVQAHFQSQARKLGELIASRRELFPSMAIPGEATLNDASVPDEAIAPGIDDWKAKHVAIQAGAEWEAPPLPETGRNGYGEPLPPH